MTETVTKFAPPKRVTTVLRRTAEILEGKHGYGWTRGQLVRERGGRIYLCLDGALLVACGADAVRGADHLMGLGPTTRVLYNDAFDAVDAVVKAEEPPIGFQYFDLFGWNDDQRDRRKVARLVRHALKNYERDSRRTTKDEPDD